MVLQTTVKDWFTTCNATLTVVVVAPAGPPCSQKVTMYNGYNGAPVTATLAAGSTNWCLVNFPVPAGHAFVYPIGGLPQWYFTGEFTCKAGVYDGANCYIMTAPAITTAFINSNAFYYLY